MKRLPRASENGPEKRLKKANPTKYTVRVIAINEEDALRSFPMPGIAGR
jgi:hypothetical protein